MTLFNIILHFQQGSKRYCRYLSLFLLLILCGNSQLAFSDPCGIDSVIVSQPTCNSLCDGSIFIYASGDGNLVYSWQQIPGADSSFVEGLCAGNYIYSITDSTGCNVTDTIQIIDPDTISFTITTIPSTCPGGCTGSITVLPLDTLPFTYQWPGYLSTTAMLGNICQGTYNVIITNSFNCSVLATVNVDYEAPFELNFITTPSTCQSSCDGSATALTSVNGTFNYQWLTGPIQNTQTAFNLCIGSYGVIVTDTLGCVVSDSVYIDNLAPPVINTSSTPPVCFGGCDGEAQILTDTTIAYSFEWNTFPPQFSSVATGLCEGVYSFIVTDLATGCSYIDSVAVFNPMPFSVSTASVPSTCTNFCNGFATVFTNAPPPLSYLWSSGSTTESDSLLCPGLYTVSILDSLGCTETAVVNVSSQSPGIITSNSTCNNICDGTAEVSLPFPGDWDIEWNTIPVQTNLLATDLCEGTYIVDLEDSSGCELSAQAVILPSQPISIVDSINPVGCYGDCDGRINLALSGINPITVVWNTNPPQNTNTINDLCAGSYISIVTDGQGCTRADTFMVGSPLMPDFNYSVIPNSCSGICNAAAVVTPVLSGNYSILWQTSPVQSGFTALGLCPGPTAIIATDSFGCVVNDTLNIIDTSPITPNLITFDVSCYGDCDGFINCQPWGGTPGYNYLWSNGFTTPQLLNACPGSYSVTITDAMGCSVSNSTTVNEPDTITLTFTVAPSTCTLCNDGSVMANAVGGTPPYTYLWTPGGVQGSFRDSLVAGLYNVCVIDDNNCSKCKDVIVTTFNGLDDHDMNDFNIVIAPNPFNATARLILNSEFLSINDKFTLSIFDPSGKKYENFNVTRNVINNNTIVFDIIDSGASSGMYFVRVISENSIIYTGKIIFYNGIE